ncbi:hypothetical protein [Streptodolium elevatio]|uniref:MarR family transcriptional regulator n=1 Tax=Streptodolium elevatio TaxID=3157996 RepID=A0ABV3DR33_9ACTN
MPIRPTPVPRVHTPGADLLIFMARMPGPHPATALAAEHGLSMQGVNRALRILRDHGWAASERTDGTVRHTLTAHGEAAARFYTALHAAPLALTPVRLAMVDVLALQTDADYYAHDLGSRATAHHTAAAALLTALHECGWATRTPEQHTPDTPDHRALRTYYRLTRDGRHGVAAIATAARQARTELGSVPLYT